MSMQDPIADMFIRIRNAQAVAKQVVKMSASKIKVAIAKLLEQEGFINGYDVAANGAHQELTIELKYHNGKPVIAQLERVSRSSLRVYKQAKELPKVKEGLGVAIISTSHGLMTDRDARKAGFGGEIIGIVS